MQRENGLPATMTFFRFCSPPRFWTVSVDVAVHALNRMLELGRPESVRIA